MCNPFVRHVVVALRDAALLLLVNDSTAVGTGTTSIGTSITKAPRRWRTHKVNPNFV